MNELPKVTPFEIKKKLNNSQERFSSADKPVQERKVNVIHKINEIFASNNHVYKSRVRIKTKDDILERTIVGKTGAELLTLTGEKISIASVLDIERI